eukprot:Pgem_evm1s10801
MSTDVPREVVVERMKMFEDEYNVDNTAKSASIYSKSCLVTVNGGVENGGPFTGKTPEEVAGNVHYDTWTCDAGTGACRAEWEVQDGQWVATKDEITFTPKS